MSTVWDDIEMSTMRGCGALSKMKDRICRTNIIRGIQRLADARACSEMAPHWICHRKNGQGYEIAISESAPDRAGRDFPAIRLENLQFLQDGALLSLRMLVDPRRKGLPATYVVGLQGSMKENEQAWYARLEVAEPRHGSGRCGHPLLHLQTGSDADTKMQVRGPLPWLMPWEALDWLLVTADPRFEPCPHS